MGGFDADIGDARGVFHVGYFLWRFDPAHFA
jgi:hypothetical protein